MAIAVMVVTIIVVTTRMSIITYQKKGENIYKEERGSIIIITIIARIDMAG
jgi:hypothetical protein